MPIELHFILSSEVVKRVLWVEGETNEFEIVLPETPKEVQFDPEGWVLCKLNPFQKKRKGGR
jgi:hypothetical protein